MIKFVKFIKRWFTLPSVPCDCGGEIVPYQNWVGDYFICKKCDEAISSDRYEYLVRLYKKR